MEGLDGGLRGESHEHENDNICNYLGGNMTRNVLAFQGLKRKPRDGVNVRRKLLHSSLGEKETKARMASVNADSLNQPCTEGCFRAARTHQISVVHVGRRARA